MKKNYNSWFSMLNKSTKKEEMIYKINKTDLDVENALNQAFREIQKKYDQDDLTAFVTKYVALTHPHRKEIKSILCQALNMSTHDMTSAIYGGKVVTKDQLDIMHNMINNFIYYEFPRTLTADEIAEDEHDRSLEESRWKSIY